MTTAATQIMAVRMHLDSKLSILIRQDIIIKIDVLMLASGQLIRMSHSVCSCSSRSVQQAILPDKYS